jgi:hypothetical protein
LAKVRLQRLLQGRINGSANPFNLQAWLLSLWLIIEMDHVLDPDPWLTGCHFVSGVAWCCTSVPSRTPVAGGDAATSEGSNVPNQTGPDCYVGWQPTRSKPSAFGVSLLKVEADVFDAS